MYVLFLAITSREIIIFVVIIFIGLLVFVGLFHICRKRQMRMLITPIQNKKMQADNARQQQIEERSEGVYDEIDESAISKTITPSTVQPSLYNSYLDVIDDPCNPMDTKDLPSSISMIMISSQNEPVQHLTLRRQQQSFEDNMYDLNIKSGVGNEYSGGYLRPMFYDMYHSIDIISENQKTLSNKKKMATKEENGRIYFAPAYAGISRSASYDRLIFTQNVGNRTNESVLVHNPHDPVHCLNIQVDKKNRQSKCKILASQRKTI